MSWVFPCVIAKRNELDFETRCPLCAKRLNMIVKRAGDRGLLLTPEECEEHPGEAMILWPQRDDIINV